VLLTIRDRARKLLQVLQLDTGVIRLGVGNEELALHPNCQVDA